GSRSAGRYEAGSDRSRDLHLRRGDGGQKSTPQTARMKVMKFDGSPDVSSNPKGIGASSPGLRRRSYPGSTTQRDHNPQRVAAVSTTLSGLKKFFVGSPRGVASRQPWAGGRNPVGIRRDTRHRLAALWFTILCISSVHTFGAASNATLRFAGIPSELTISEVSERTMRIELFPLDEQG